MGNILGIPQSEINGWLLLIVIALILPIVFNLLKPRFWIGRATEIHVNTEMKILSIECAFNAIITSDVNGVILQWNKGAERMIGFTEHEMLGKNIINIIPERYRERHLQGMQRVKEYGHSDILGRALEFYCLRKNGTEFPISLKLSKETRGPNVFFVGVIRDMTKDILERNKMQLHLNLYEYGEQIAGLGTWRWNVTDDVVEGSKEFKRIFDEDEAAAPASFFLQKVWRGHREAVDIKIKQAVQTGKGYEVQYGVVRKDGTVAIVHCKAIVERRAMEPAAIVPTSPPKLIITGIVQVLKVIDFDDVEDFDILNKVAI